MKCGVFSTAAAALLLSACGYKGGLYLSKKGGKARFDVIQTSLPIHIPASQLEPDKAKAQP